MKIGCIASLSGIAPRTALCPSEGGKRFVGTGLYAEKSPWVFIALKGNKLIGWISYYSLLGPPFRACLLGLLLGIEQAMADLIKTDAELAISKLPAKRLEAATRVFGLRGYAKQRREDPTPSELIDCTNFIDKVTLHVRLYGLDVRAGMAILPATRLAFFPIEKGIFSRLGAEPKHIALDIFELHFRGPRVVLWFLENFHGN